ncbi:MAG TPA: hypothetical protein VFV89_06905 [Nocardioides sp.]|uniref:hypothetical protein n=1 Tax=Nocardioides sp. TaxID=35761 RepID=UPI002E34B0BB|nr:hypothetical protein [Nocardioides sp.]HEX5087521.1 hypothetical protein [Nocardioides sp.]
MDINVNGQSYSRWEDVPAEVRQQLAATLPDADKNGVPDLFETGALPTGAQAFTSTSIIVNGQPVQSAADLPRELQAQLQQALGMLSSAFGPAATPAAPGTPAPAAPGAPLQPGQVMLNGVPTTPGEATAPAKPWWKRLFGG